MARGIGNVGSGITPPNLGQPLQPQPLATPTPASTPAPPTGQLTPIDANAPLQPVPDAGRVAADPTASGTAAPTGVINLAPIINLFTPVTVAAAERADVEVEIGAVQVDLQRLSPQVLDKIGKAMFQDLPELHLQVTEVLQGMVAAGSRTPPPGGASSDRAGLAPAIAAGQGNLPANSAQVSRSFEDYLSRVPTDPAALVQWVLRESYLEQLQDLAFYAQKVRFFNETKRLIREEAQRARNRLAGLGNEKDTFQLDPPFETKQFDGSFNGQGSSGGSGAVTPEQQAQLDKRKADQAELEQLRQAREAAPLIPRSAKVSEITQSMNAAGSGWSKHDYAGVQTSKEAMKERLLEDVDKFLAWFETLPPEQQRAVLATMDFEVNVRGRKPGAGDPYDHDSKQGGKLIPPPDCKDVGAWLEVELKKKVGQWVDQAANAHGGGGAVDLRELCFRPSIKGTSDFAITWNESAPKSARELELEKSLGLADVSDGWTEGEACMTKGELDNYIKHLEEKLNTVGDDAQLANVDLQNNLQKQQQLLQMLSNISKMLHDTASGIIRKIGG